MICKALCKLRSLCARRKKESEAEAVAAVVREPIPIIGGGEIHSDVQNLSLGALVTLYELDLTPIDPIGGYVQRFSNETMPDGSNVVWQGNEYQVMPIRVRGFEQNVTGRAPKPRIEVNAVGGLVPSIAKAYGDLIGARLTRRRTFFHYLDGQSLADPLAEFPTDVYIVERKVRANKFALEYECVALHDLQGTMLPKRIIIPTACSHTYTGEECQWTKTAGFYFDEFGNVVATPQEDVCGKRLVDCAARWEGRDGAGTPLTFGGYPGVQRLYR